MQEQEAEEEDKLLLLHLVNGKTMNSKDKWKLCNKLTHNNHQQMTRKTEKVSCWLLFVEQETEMA